MIYININPVDLDLYLNNVEFSKCYFNLVRLTVLYPEAFQLLDFNTINIDLESIKNLNIK